jgi:hypothetical protein
MLLSLSSRGGEIGRTHANFILPFGLSFVPLLVTISKLLKSAAVNDLYNLLLSEVSACSLHSACPRACDLWLKAKMDDGVRAEFTASLSHVVYQVDNCIAAHYNWQLTITASRLEAWAYADIGVTWTLADYVLSQPRPFKYPQRMIPASLPHRYKYNFVGSVFGLIYGHASPLPLNMAPRSERSLRHLYYSRRSVVISFAQRNFDSDSFLYIIDAPSNYTRLGSWDHTTPVRSLDHMGMNQTSFLRILSSSDFTLCPEGDHPWSFRFFEAIASKSIPIVWRLDGGTRNPQELRLGYKFFMHNEPHVFEEWIVEHNWRIFQKHQLLMNGT